MRLRWRKINTYEVIIIDGKSLCEEFDLWQKKKSKANISEAIFSIARITRDCLVQSFTRPISGKKIYSREPNSEIVICIGSDIEDEIKQSMKELCLVFGITVVENKVKEIASYDLVLASVGLTTRVRWLIYKTIYYTSNKQGHMLLSDSPACHLVRVLKKPRIITLADWIDEYGQLKETYYPEWQQIGNYMKDAKVITREVNESQTQRWLANHGYEDMLAPGKWKVLSNLIIHPGENL